MHKSFTADGQTKEAIEIVYHEIDQISDGIGHLIKQLECYNRQLARRNIVGTEENLEALEKILVEAQDLAMEEAGGMEMWKDEFNIVRTDS